MWTFQHYSSTLSHPEFYETWGYTGIVQAYVTGFMSGAADFFFQYASCLYSEN